MDKTVILSGQMRSGTTFLGCFLDAQNGIALFSDLLHIGTIHNTISSKSFEDELSWNERLKVLACFYGPNRGLETLSVNNDYEFDLEISPADFSTLKEFYLFVLTLLGAESRVLGHKTTNSEFAIEELLLASENTYCIHMYRDPRDIGLSSKKMWASRSLFTVMRDWAEGWKAMKTALTNPKIKDRILQVNYENLMRNTEDELERIRAFLEVKEIQMQVQMERYGKSYMSNSSYDVEYKLFDSGSIGRWKSRKHLLGYMANRVIGKDVLSEAKLETYRGGRVRSGLLNLWFNTGFLVRKSFSIVYKRARALIGSLE